MRKPLKGAAKISGQEKLCVAMQIPAANAIAAISAVFRGSQLSAARREFAAMKVALTAPLAVSTDVPLYSSRLGILDRRRPNR